jgi:two-component system sensor histidine kinase DesK
MPTRKRPHLSGFFWVAIWLSPLLGPLATVGERAQPAWLAGGGLVAFGLVYTLLVWLSFEGVGTLRAQATGYAVTLALALALAIGYGPGWLQVMLYAINAAAAVFGGYHHLLKLAAVLSFGVAAVTVVIGLAWHAGLAEIVSTAGGGLLSAALVFVVRQMSRLIGELRTTREQLAESAVAEERLRFSRDLHDLLGHTLSVVVVKSEAARRLAPRDLDAALDQVADIEAVGRQALTEIREAVTGYRDGSLATELERARSALGAAGIEALVRESGPPLPSQAEALLGWVVREGATNVIRHSGASSCAIALTGADGRVRLEITDDGSGAGSTATGNGLKGLAERLATAGGSLQTGPGGRKGFRLVAELPVEEEAHAV